MEWTRKVRVGEYRFVVNNSTNNVEEMMISVDSNADYSLQQELVKTVGVLADVERALECSAQWSESEIDRYLDLVNKVRDLADKTFGKRCTRYTNVVASEAYFLS